MLALTLSLLLANSATATDSPQLEAARHRHHLALTAQLERSSSPRDWALASRLIDSGYPEKMDWTARGTLLRKAAEAAPADRLVQWMWAGMNDAHGGCSERNPCPGRKLAVAKLEPDNAAGWLFAFPKAAEGAAVGEEFLHRVAQLPRYDEPTIDAWFAWTDFHRAHPIPASLYPDAKVPVSAEQREVQAIISGIAYGTMVMAPMQDVFRFCSRKNHPNASESRFRDCDRLGRLIAGQSRSVMMEMMGLGLRRAAAVDADEAKAARRLHDWRLRQYVAMAAEWDTKPRETLAFYRDVVDTGSEIRAQELALARAGIGLEPPADWQAPTYE